MRVLKLTGASTLQYWQMLGRDYMLNDGASGYPAWQVLRQMQQQLPAGSQVVETSGDRGLLYSLAARDGGDFVLYLVNGGTADQPVAVSGLPAGSYRQVRSSAAGYQELRRRRRAAVSPRREPYGCDVVTAAEERQRCHDLRDATAPRDDRTGPFDLSPRPDVSSARQPTWRSPCPSPPSSRSS